MIQVGGGGEETQQLCMACMGLKCPSFLKYSCPNGLTRRRCALGNPNSAAWHALDQSVEILLYSQCAPIMLSSRMTASAKLSGAKKISGMCSAKGHQTYLNRCFKLCNLTSLNGHQQCFKIVYRLQYIGFKIPPFLPRSSQARSPRSPLLV